MADVEVTERLIVGESPGRGRGVFAGLDLEAGDLIETVPVITLPPTEHLHIHLTVLGRYSFSWPPFPRVVALPLGFGMIYNHSPDPNARWENDTAENLIHFIAVRPIAKGEEITHDYGRQAYRGNAVDPMSVWLAGPRRSVIAVAAGAAVVLGLVGRRRRRARRAGAVNK